MPKNNLATVLAQASSISMGDLMRQYPGFRIHQEYRNKWKNFNSSLEEHFTWIQEALVEMKKSMNSEEVQLVPKTPSTKHARQMLHAKSVIETIDEDEDEEIYAKNNHGKKCARTKKNVGKLNLDDTNNSVTSVDTDEETCRPRRNTRSAKASSSSTSTRSTRNTRSRKGNSKTDEEQTRGPQPVLSIQGVVLKEKIPETIEEEPESTSKGKNVVVISESEDDSVFMSPLTKKSRLKTAAKAEMSDMSVRMSSPHLKTTGKLGSTASPSKPSPKSIPGFANLSHVKEKASAYEKYLQATHGNSIVEIHESSSSEESNNTPSKRPKMSLNEITNKALETPNESILSLLVISKKKQDLKASSNESRKNKETEDSLKKVKRRSSSTVRRLSGVSKSMVRKKSSMFRQKLRSSLHMTAAQQDEQLKEFAQSKPKDLKNKSAEESSTSTDSSSGTPNHSRKTRLKMHHNKPSPPKLSVEETKDDDKLKVPEPPMARSTRSKMRHASKPVSTSSSSDVSTPGSHKIESSGSEHGTPRIKTTKHPERTTRSKMRKKLSASNSDEENEGLPLPNVKPPSSAKMIRSTRSKMRKVLEENAQKTSGSSTSELDEASPPKKSCSIKVNPCLSEARYMGPIHPKSFLNQLKKHGTPATNHSGVLTSFLQRNTPKKLPVKDQLLKKAKEIEAKAKDTEERINKKREEMLKRAVEARKKREERQKLAAARRLDQERQERQLREKKMAVALSRRREEEELKQQKLKKMEEQQRQEEALRQKHALEEEEHQRKIEAMKKAQEEQRVEAERECAREAERKREQAELRKRQEEEKRREKEERVRLEREEKEQQEQEKQKERKKQAQQEVKRDLEKHKANESVTQQSPSKGEKHQLEGEKKVDGTSQTQNKPVLESSTSDNISDTKPPTCHPNSTFNKEEADAGDNPDSYDMTPTRKAVKKSKRDSNDNNYNINDLHSDDSTDDEDAPRKKIPTWAIGSNLKMALINQHYNPPNLDEIFRDGLQILDLNVVFSKPKARFNKRTSSACWDSPMLQPSGAPFHFPIQP